MTSIEFTKNTKDRILEVANSLFAKNGFGGTSIRDIANEAGVNLAAINYHFKSKENLYWSVFEYNYDWLSLGIQSLDDDNIDICELSIRTFKFFLQEKTAVLNIFKILLSDKTELLEENNMLECDGSEIIGPPGFELFLKKIAIDLNNYNCSEHSLAWAVKTVFSIISHKSLMMSSKYFENKCVLRKELSPQTIELEIKHSVYAVIGYLKENPSLK